MSVALLALASVLYAIGGVFMKTSDGLTQPRPTAVFLALFAVAALLQARGMKQGEMSPAYILVLGLEAVSGVLLGAFVLHDALTLSRVGAMLLVVVGVVWLRLT